MKITNAFWEVRNSGLTTCEILFEKGDSFEDYVEAKIEEKFQYSVVKISSDNLALLHKLEKNGYSFLETQFHVRVSVTEIDNIIEKWPRILSGTSFHKLKSQDELEIILSNIRQGMFNHDRISMDEKLEKETSAKRFANWIADLYREEKIEIYFLTNHNTKVGFFIIQDSSVSFLNSVIAGIFNEHKGHGLSVAIIYYYLKIAQVKNKKYVFTSFSSNNLDMLNSFNKTVSYKTLRVLYVLSKLL